MNGKYLKRLKDMPGSGAFPALLALVVAGLLLVYWVSGGGPAAGPEETGQASVAARVESREHNHSAESDGHGPERGEVVYACPMMCVPPMPDPGNCPICGMELLPVSAGPADDVHGRPRLQLSGEAARLAGIQVAPAERKFVEAEIRLFGKLDYDPSHTTVITAFMPGVIDRVYVRRAGQFVRWGDPLFDIYSSDLLAAQEQLIKAMKHVPPFLAFQKSQPHAAREAPVQERDSSAGVFERTLDVEEALKTIDAIRHKLSILGLPRRDIDELMKKGEATGLATVYASMYGQVTEFNATEGSYVNTGTPLFTLADPEFIWARLEAYEADFPWIRKGQKVTFTTEAYPGETFEGRVVYIDPVFDTRSRTFKIGALSTDDKGGKLKAGLLARGVIHASLDADGSVIDPLAKKGNPPLVIPATAPLVTGTRAVVYVAVPGEKGVFEGREIVLGPKARDYYVVLEGLSEGEQVVTNGSFKIDSTLQIMARPSFMYPAGHKTGTAAETGPEQPMHRMTPDEPARPIRQFNGGSDKVNENYQEERMESRLNGQRITDETIMNRYRRKAGSTPAMEGGQTTIERRRPGRYGDTTRPKATILDK